jgi:rSAM/selenodomain-associated transferase 1
MRTRPLIILFAKAPVPGHVKTRLQPPLSADAAAALQTAFVSDMLDMLKAGIPDVDLELHTDLPTEAWARHGVAHKLQASGGLGTKLLFALAGALMAGRPRAMVVGSDAPTLPASHLRALLSCSADVALGPATDGGYYAIGCRQTHPRMFDGVAWSGPDTLELTQEAARACGLTVETGPEWFDVDMPEDLDRLLAVPDLPRQTAAWRKSWLG